MQNMRLTKSLYETFSKMKWNVLKRKSIVKKITEKTKIGTGKDRDWRQHTPIYRK